MAASIYGSEKTSLNTHKLDTAEQCIISKIPGEFNAEIKNKFTNTTLSRAEQIEFFTKHMNQIKKSIKSFSNDENFFRLISECKRLFDKIEISSDDKYKILKNFFDKLYNDDDDDDDDDDDSDYFLHKKRAEALLSDFNEVMTRPVNTQQKKLLEFADYATSFDDAHGRDAHGRGDNYVAGTRKRRGNKRSYSKRKGSKRSYSKRKGSKRSYSKRKGSKRKSTRRSI
jgi:hypothetical protein